MIRNLQPCACSATRRLGDAASDIASYQAGGTNYIQPLAEDTYHGEPIDNLLTFTPEALAALTQSPAPTTTAKPSATNWPVIGAAALGTILLLATFLPQPGRGRR